MEWHFATLSQLTGASCKVFRPTEASVTVCVFFLIQLDACSVCWEFIVIKAEYI